MNEKQQLIQENLEPQYDPQVEVVGNWKIVDLPIIKVITGMENDQIIAKFNVRLYRWKNDQWKQRGIGELKFLKDKTNKKIRILMREDKTFKVRANHLIKKLGPFCNLQKMKTHENSWTWLAFDSSDQPKGLTQKFSVRLKSQQQFAKFQEQFQNACLNNSQIK